MTYVTLADESCPACFPGEIAVLPAWEDADELRYEEHRDRMVDLLDVSEVPELEPEGA